MKILNVIAVVALLAAGQSMAEEVAGNVLALTGGAGAERSAESRISSLSRGGASTYTIDYVSDSSGTAMDFAVKIDGGARTKVNTANCVSDLPSTHTGDCRYHADRGILKVVVFSMTNAPLHTGPIGSIQVSGAKSVQIVKDSLTVSDSDGNKVSAEVL